MFKPVRVVATIIFLGSIGLVFVGAFVIKSDVRFVRSQSSRSPYSLQILSLETSIRSCASVSTLIPVGSCCATGLTRPASLRHHPIPRIHVVHAVVYPIRPFSCTQDFWDVIGSHNKADSQRSPMVYALSRQSRVFPPHATPVPICKGPPPTATTYPPAHRFYVTTPQDDFYSPRLSLTLLVCAVYAVFIEKYSCVLSTSMLLLRCPLIYSLLSRRTGRECRPSSFDPSKLQVHSIEMIRRPLRSFLPLLRIDYDVTTVFGDNFRGSDTTSCTETRQFRPNMFTHPLKLFLSSLSFCITPISDVSPVALLMKCER